MTSTMKIVMSAVLTVLVSAPSTDAQCAFDSPTKAGKFFVSLVAAFPECGYFRCAGGPNGETPCVASSECPGGTCEVPHTAIVPNTTSATGVDACAPPLTFGNSAGNPSNGWRWDPAGSSGSVQAKSGKNKLVHPLIPDPENSRDVFLQAKLTGILDGTGVPANGVGSLQMVVRLTFQDMFGGPDMTSIDWPMGIQLVVIDGKGSLKHSLNQVWVNIGGLVTPGLPCRSSEIVSLKVVDPAGNTFAAPGLR